MSFSIRSAVGPSYTLEEQDVLKTKRALSRLGHYKTPKHGTTPWPDAQMFVGLKSFQKTSGLKADGVMRPDGATEKTIRRQLSASAKKGGSYIWHTKGDGKVRSAHAERDGKVFSWDNPPEGGHPGEAPNCRCWAEAAAHDNCEIIYWEIHAARKRFNDLFEPINNARRDLDKANNILEKATRDLDQAEWEKRKLVIPSSPSKLLKKGAPIGWALTLVEVARKNREINAIKQS